MLHYNLGQLGILSFIALWDRFSLPDQTLNLASVSIGKQANEFAVLEEMDRQEDDSVELVVTQNVELEDVSQLDSGLESIDIDASRRFHAARIVLGWELVTFSVTLSHCSSQSICRVSELCSLIATVKKEIPKGKPLIKCPMDISEEVELASNSEKVAPKLFMKLKRGGSFVLEIVECNVSLRLLPATNAG
ncbi:hypothetical protein RHMOL_Rhmol10G0211500 [Rhododendron molle]|uniref:Uncharacterized protein n=1 Tax=Rhododendron molle TaxID=49168 RepID=A0ACC0M4S0_RHOML|nr:hypothetical protein RHMOL_Rhmol10G0211500 [Rhododendron molle]